MRFERSLLPAALLVVLLIAAGGSVLGIQKLKPEHKEFLSLVSYIITPAERKEFLALPDSAKPEFIERFWKRRDPDPSTEANEFKDEYVGRIAMADRQFFGEGRPGRLTDRGRIYILFGPPTERTTTSSAADPGGRCREIWYYEDFPVVFLDRSCTGTFRLATLDLSPIADRSLAKESAPKPFFPSAQKAGYDFDVTLKKKRWEGPKVDILVEISIPYSAIWLSLEKGKFVTTFEIQLALKDHQGILRWEGTQSYDLSLTSDELKDKLKSRYQVEIPLQLEKDAEVLAQGQNKLLIVLKNKKIGEEIRKTVEFNL
ncbi:MAG: GWxTD domain-containing protein [Candidatus Aminicenantes bacterium]|nr:GWxTD domain-containing protein [Candidatus Aminicenantes bacterium]